MADNYLGRKLEEYEQRKAARPRRSKYGLDPTVQMKLDKYIAISRQQHIAENKKSESDTARSESSHTTKKP